jgi:hypothetical protein
MSAPRLLSSAPSARGQSVGRWRFLILVEIANYAMLRRHVGARRAETLAMDIAERLAASAPSADARAAGRDLIELELNASSRGALDELLADFETLFAEPVSFDAEPYLVEITVGAAAASETECDEVRLIEEAEHAPATSSATSRAPARRSTGSRSRASCPRRSPRASCSSSTSRSFTCGGRRSPASRR